MPFAQATPLQQEIRKMRTHQIWDAIGEIIGSISAERPNGIDGIAYYRVQRDAVAEVCSMMLSGVRPRNILEFLLDKFEGFPVVEWWRTRILTDQ